jgi:hypothetical protein
MSIKKYVSDYFPLNKVGILLGITVLVRVLFELLIIQINPDNSFQLTIAYNILNGNGIYFNSLSIQDLSQISYEAIAGWPYFYPFLITIGGLFLDNLLTVAIITDALFAALLVFSVFKLSEYLECDRATQIMFLLFALLHSTIFFKITSTGLISLSLLILAIAYTVKKVNGQITTKQILIATILGTLPALFRFAYFPVAVMVPLVWGSLHLLDRKRINFKQVLYSFSTAIGIVVFLFLFHKMLTGYITFLMSEKYVKSDTLSFYPSHLKYFYPFISEAILPKKIFQSFLHLFSAGAYTNHLLLIVTIAMIVFGVRQSINLLRFNKTSPAAAFLISAFWTIVIVTSVLSTMSLIKPMRHFTQVQGYRYHAPSIFLIGLSFIYLLMNTKWRHKRKLGIAVIFILLLSNLNFLNRSPYWSFPTNQVGDTIFRHHDIIKKSAGENKRYSYYLYNNSYMNIYGVPTLFEYSSLLNKKNLTTSKPITLFLGMHKDKAPSEERFLKQNQPTEYYDLPFTDLYRFDIEPTGDTGP